MTTRPYPTTAVGNLQSGEVQQKDIVTVLFYVLGKVEDKDRASACAHMMPPLEPELRHAADKVIVAQPPEKNMARRFVDALVRDRPHGPLNSDYTEMETLIEKAKAGDAATKRIKDAEAAAAAAEHKAKAAATEAQHAQESLRMWDNAWARELGPFFRHKTHRIDALVCSTRDLRAALSDTWALLNRSLVLVGSADYAARADDTAKFIADYKALTTSRPGRATVLEAPVPAVRPILLTLRAYDSFDTLDDKQRVMRWNEAIETLREIEPSLATGESVAALPTVPAALSGGETYAIIQFLERFAPADSFVTALQIRLQQIGNACYRDITDSMKDEVDRVCTKVRFGGNTPAAKVCGWRDALRKIDNRVSPSPVRHTEGTTELADIIRDMDLALGASTPP